MSAAPYAGISLALLAATAYNVGLIQEKRALGRMPALDVRRMPHVIASLLADPAWLAGFALMLLGLACQIIVLTFEPVSVVQPVLASGVALVLVLSRVVLRERLGAVEFRCVAAMAVSVILLAASAGGTGSGAGHHASPGWMAAVMIPSAVIGLLVAASPLRDRSRRPPRPGGGLLRHRHRTALRRRGAGHQGAVGNPGPQPRRREHRDRRRLVALPVRVRGLLGRRHAALPGGAAVLPGLHPRPGVHRHGQCVLPDRGHLAVPRAAAG